MSVNDQYALNWSNHTNHIRKAFDSLLAGNEFVDVTLSCEGKKVSAHKMLLSACSTYFHDLFRDNPCQHPIVILKDVKFQNLLDILKFMYNGEVSVATENFDSFLKTAELLQVSGLTDDENRYSCSEKDDGSENSQATFVQQSSDKPTLKPLIKKTSIEKPKEKEVTKKRTTEASIEEGTSQKKRKDSELQPDVEIKQEEDVIHLEDENVQIRDPLELDDQNESIEGMELLQPVRSRYIQKHRLTQSKRRDTADRRIRRHCFHCRNKVKKMGGSAVEIARVKKVSSYCGACPDKPFMCAECFDSIH